MVVIQKLAEHLETLRKVLVDKVDGGVSDASPVCPDGVCDVSDADGVQMFSILGVQRFLDEALRVQVVVVPRDKDVDVSHDLERVQSLLESLPGQFNLRKGNPVLLHSQIAHFTVRLRARDKWRTWQKPIEINNSNWRLKELFLFDCRARAFQTQERVIVHKSEERDLTFQLCKETAV